jgi:hypothetical protein
MESKIHANKGWQRIGKIPSAGNLYADGTWCFNTRERDARTCDAKGYGVGKGNYYIMNIDKGDKKYPYSGEKAIVGQAIFRVGENGSPEALGLRGAFRGGEDVWMMINDTFDGLDDNDGSLQLRFVPAGGRSLDPTNSLGDPIGTQYPKDTFTN